MDSFESSFASNSGDDMAVDRTLHYHWQETAKWGRIISIIYFVVLGIGLIAMFGVFAVLSNMSELLAETEGSMGMAPGSTLYNVFMGIAIAAMLFGAYLNYLHLQFVNKLKLAISNNSQDDFEAAWRSLRTCFRWYGYLTIAYIVIYIGAFLFFGAAMRSMFMLGRGF